MANICLYRIQVKGTEKACRFLTEAMPQYCDSFEILDEYGTPDDFTLSFQGDCKWSVDAYTEDMNDPKPWTEAELDAADPYDHWGTTLKDKSILLNCEIWCASMDIDDGVEPDFEHWKRGNLIYGGDWPELIDISPEDF